MAKRPLNRIGEALFEELHGEDGFRSVFESASQIATLAARSKRAISPKTGKPNALLTMYPWINETVTSQLPLSPKDRGLICIEAALRLKYANRPNFADYVIGKILHIATQAVPEETSTGSIVLTERQQAALEVLLAKGLSPRAAAAIKNDWRKALQALRGITAVQNNLPGLGVPHATAIKRALRAFIPRGQK